MGNTEALNAYMQHLSAIRAHLEALQSLVDDHFGTDPDSITWANVGDLTRIESALSQLVNPET